MNRIVAAIQEGCCSIAVSGSLLRDPDVMLELTRRGALAPMALSGPAVSPVLPVGDAGLARALAHPNGVVVLVDPQGADNNGVAEVARHVSRAANTPTIIVVARSYNPLQYAFQFKGAAVAHVKERGKKLVSMLPMPGEDVTVTPVPEVVKAKKARASHPGAPRFHFAGREEELAQLTEILGEGGPVVLSGPEGVGRTWLLDHAAAGAGLTRHLDVMLGWGTGFDTLIARLAAITADCGNTTLAEAISAKLPPLQLVAKAIETLKATEDAGSHLLVVRELDRAMGRSADFFRKSRLEVLLRELLRNTYPLRVVFVARSQPRFFKEGEDAGLRRVELEGLKGRFLHEIFESYKAPEFPREHFGPLSERLHGHPMAARMFAIAMREREDGLDLLEEPKFLRMESVHDAKPLKKHLRKKVDALPKKARATLAGLTHLRHPLSGSTLAQMGLGRRDRLALLAQGLLDMGGTLDDRHYRVHTVVHYSLSRRETTQFDEYKRAAEVYTRLGREAEGDERLAYKQEVNLCRVQSRNLRDLVPTPFPDADALVDSAVDMMRMHSPRHDLAERRLKSVLQVDENNTDAWLALIECHQRAQADKEVIQEAFDEALAKAPVPELYHQLANWHLSRRARGQAVTALEAAIELMPDEARLRTRLASLLLQSGRRREGLEQLRVAMELEPMLPDAYGLLGQARRLEGRESLPEAESLLREAVRLAPGDPVQTSRLVGLLLDLAQVDAERTEALYEEATELLEDQLKGDPTADAFLLYASLLRRQGKDLERCDWLLGKAKKVLGRRKRNTRLMLERALLELAQGHLDEAEKRVRKLAEKEPTNPEVFAALAQVLEARGLFIPAHAEYLRAQERTSPVSLARERYDAELARLQALIEAQVAGLVPGLPVDEDEPAITAPIDPAAAHSHQRVIRRRRGEPEQSVTPGEDETPVPAEVEAEEAPKAAASEE